MDFKDPLHGDGFFSVMDPLHGDGFFGVMDPLHGDGVMDHRGTLTLYSIHFDASTTDSF